MENDKFTQVEKDDEEVALELFTYKHPSFSICLVSMFVTSCLCVLINQMVTRCNGNHRNVSHGVISNPVPK